MEKYCKTYFKIYNIKDIDEFNSLVKLTPDKIIEKDNIYELHFGYYDKYQNDLEPMYYETIKNLIPYLDNLILLKEKGVKFKLMVDTNIKNIEKFTVVRFEISHFMHYLHAYNDEFSIW